MTEFVFENGGCVPVPSLWQQGSTNTLFYRALDDGTKLTTVICDSDGKLVIADGENPSYVEYLVNSDQIGLRSANRDALIAAAGGSVVADVFSDNDGNYLLISLDGYTVVADLDGILALGSIPIWSKQLTAVTKSGSYYYLGDASGSVLALDDGSGNTQIVQVNYDAQLGHYAWGDFVSNVGPEYNVINIPATTSDGGINWDFTFQGIAYHLEAYAENWLVPNNVIEFRGA